MISLKDEQTQASALTPADVQICKFDKLAYPKGLTSCVSLALSLACLYALSLTSQDNLSERPDQHVCSAPKAVGIGHVEYAVVDR